MRDLAVGAKVLAARQFGCVISMDSQFVELAAGLSTDRTGCRETSWENPEVSDGFENWHPMIEF